MDGLTSAPLNGGMTPNEQMTALTAYASSASRVGRSTSADLVLMAAIVTTGLIAGTYFAYACSVMPALGRTGDRAFIEVMQRINVAIQNPVFFLAFFGALVLTGIAVWQQRGSGAGGALGWTIAALVLYSVSLLITMAGNIPLNNRLDAAGDPARIADPAAVRERVEHAWIAWNIARTLAATAALGCLGQALRSR
jgi:uncharacterized membrane protein